MPHTFSTTPAAKPPATIPITNLAQDLKEFAALIEQKTADVSKRLITEKKWTDAIEVLSAGVALHQKLKNAGAR